MRTRPYQSAPHRHRLRGLTATVLSAALLSLLAALPAAPANAGAPTAAPSTTLPATISALSAGEVEKVLAEVPLSDLGAAQVTEALSKLPGLSTLPSGALSKTVESLMGKGATVGQLLEPTEVLTTLETELHKLLSLPELLALLKGQSLQTLLTGSLGALSASQLLDTLLGSSSEPQQLIGELLAAVNPTKLEGLLGSTLTGEPFSKTTVGSLASGLGVTVKEFSETLGSPLSETTMALTAPLTNGKTLGVLNGLEGIALTLLSPAGHESGKESESTGQGGSGGSSSGGSGGSGGTGGAGGAGATEKESSAPGGNGSGGSTTSGASSGTPGAVTVLLSDPLATPAPAAVQASPKAVGKLEILSHRVRGGLATIVVQVPAAGKISLGARGVRPVHRQASQAERLTLRTALTKAGASSLRKHRNHLQLRLTASFKPTGGPGSSAAVSVTFR
jgi:hypothetical protein